jgi:hypothetical protein
VLDTLFALLRHVITGFSVSRPDKLHYHHVLMRLVVLMTHKDIGQKEANPISSFLSWPLIVVPCTLGYYLIDDKSTSVIAIFAFTAAYVVTYHLLVYNALKLRRSVNHPGS